MSKIIDLTGQIFGNLIVIERCEDYISPKGRHQSQWLCKCDCGNETKVQARNLKKGSTKTCGHCNDIKPGDRFGSLIVIERCEDYISPKGRHQSQWLCKCDCGNETKVLSYNLKKGITKSCGCCNNIRPGDRFGNLTVIERCEDYISPKGYRSPQLLCKCSCGRKKKVIANKLKSGNIKSCGHCNDIKPGDRFGKLTAIEQCEGYIRSEGYSETQWLCKCDCGRETKVRSSTLKNSTTKSCGHCNDIEFVDPCDGEKHEGNIRNICKECGFRYEIIKSRLRQGFTFEEAVKIKSIVQVNKIYKINFNNDYFEGTIKQICEHFNKNYDQVFSFMTYNRTLEWALEHS